MNHTWLGACVLVWAFACALMISTVITSEPCCFMLLLHLVALAFGQVFLNYTCLSVCVLVWAFPCCLIEGIVITSRVLLFNASLAFARAGLRPALS
jgi:hypothetical protein